MIFFQRMALVAIAGALTVFSHVAGAQLTPNAESEQRSQAEALRQQQRTEEQRQRLERSANVLLPGRTPLEASQLPEGEAPCFKLALIGLKGPDLARFGWLVDAVAGRGGMDSPLHARSGKCIGAQGVALVLKRAQNALVAKGFVTSRVLAEPQDLSTGSLTLTVLPGRIRSIRFTDASQARRPPSNNVPAKPGDILNLRDIEQALENFKRVPTADADIQIEPASSPDQSDLVIQYRQGFPLRTSLSVDDSGNKSTGRYQSSVTVSYDNPLELSDLFYITINNDLGGGDPGYRGTQGGTVHYSLPLEYWTLGVTASNSRYYQTVAGLNQNYTYSGTSENTEIKLSRIVWRDGSSKTTASLKGFQRRSNNYIDDTEVQVQRRVVGGWELGMGHEAFVGSATLEGNLAYKRGTKDFDSIDAPEEALGEGTSKFALSVLDASVSLPLEVYRHKWRYNGSLRVQDNMTPLTPQDRFAIGGRYTVRGFDGESGLSAERGLLLRNEFSTALGRSGQEFYIGIDHGEVSGPSSELLVGKLLTGAVIGLRGNYKKLQYDIFVGAPVDKPAGFRTAETAAGFSLNMVF
jgi:hemolysin activation/secretion protein